MSDTLIVDDPEVETPTEDTTEAAVTTPRSKPVDLERDLKQVLDGIVTGTLTVPGGKSPTPHYLSILVGDLRGGEEHRPSGGAVSAALTRWVDIGFITVTAAPVAFEAYTAAGCDIGLGQLKENAKSAASVTTTAIPTTAAPSAPAEVPVFGSDAPFG